jgi:CHAD domain-containing protein
VDDSLAEAGRKVLRMHLLRMLVAEGDARAGSDIEGVHKMRVATRRMRAAWRVFDGAYRPRLQKRYVAELRSVAGALGEVRDIDVQLERQAAHRAALGADVAAALEPLVEEWRRRRVSARANLLELLDSADYDQFITDYRAFVDTAGAGAVEDSERVVNVAASRAWRAYERLRQHDQLVPFADVPALHALRIDAKRLRYTLEFLAEILPKTTERLISQIVAVQDHIGLLNDAKIAADETRAWLIESAGALTAAQEQAASGYLRASEAEVNRLRRSFGPLWRRLTGRPFRSRLASSVSAI